MKLHKLPGSTSHQCLVIGGMLLQLTNRKPDRCSFSLLCNSCSICWIFAASVAVSATPSERNANSRSMSVSVGTFIGFPIIVYSPGRKLSAYPYL
jgi:hypothetical protein